MDFIVEDDQAGGAPGGGPDGQSGSAGGSSFIVDDAPVSLLLLRRHGPVRVQGRLVAGRWCKVASACACGAGVCVPCARR